MKDRKSLYLLIFALTVVTVAFILVSIWGYNYYFQPKAKNTLTQSNQQIPFTEKTSMRDSLQTLLATTVGQLDAADSTLYDSSVDKTLVLKLIEFNKLKNEIAEILKNKTSSKDMSVASEKIGELQQSIEELRNKNNEVAEENARLNKMLHQLVENKKSRSSSFKRKTSYASSLPLLVSHLRFTGITIKELNERATNIAAQTQKLTGSFQINTKPSNSNTSIYVIIVQPNGKTLLNSSWQSGTFETSSGRKVYSAVLHFDNEKDNKNRLQFSIDSHNFQKGTYAMQIYHQGTMIGRLERTLY
jgi:hypothetical protein